MIYAIMGPSCAGKDLIFKKILERVGVDIDISELPMFSTRPPREGESQGNPYIFVDDVTINDIENRIIEERDYDTTFGVWKYGTIIPDDYTSDKDYITITTLVGYKSMCSYFEQNEDGTIVVPILINASDRVRLLRGIESRGNLIEMCRRFIADSEDFSKRKLEEINPVIFENESDMPVDDIIAFINRSKVGSQDATA